MVQTFRNAWKIPELRRKILFTLFIVLLYRLGNAVPVPYVDTNILATYFAQLCCELIPENEPAVEELRLMLNTHYCLERDKLPPLQLKAILELRLLTLTGYMPDLIACRACGGLPEDGVVLFDPSGGSICCPGCAPSGAVGLLPLPPGVFAAMRHIIYCDFEKLFQFKLGEENLPVLAHAVEQYLLCQVERILPALNFYKTICI